MIDKTYDAAAVEPRIYKAWEEAGAFRAGANARPGGKPFSIVIPPPNVTGSLHMGHALNNTLQDVLVRLERMRGRDVLWQPGTDHAGIATQMVVERQMMERQEPGRREIGRAKFLEKVWAWKAESGGTIVGQLKRLGASCDWSRERFTMDEGLSKAVVKVFVELHRQGLIYKDKRLVNWDPKLVTAISDLEVVQVETKGHLWHLRYPLADGVTYQHPYRLDAKGEKRDWKPSDGAPDGHDTRDYIVVATTRPETMLGDTGVAVHPDDPRFASLVGKHVILPPVGRRIPIVADDYSDPEKGTGAVKVTPAHDFNDFEVGRRQGLAAINILARDGTIDIVGNEDFLQAAEKTPMREELWAQLQGLDRFVARDRIVKVMEEGGFLDRIEPHPHTVPHGDRSNVVIEPYLTDQWYVDAKTLAQPAIAAVRKGKTNFIPKNWDKTYFEWMENIQPWCISRQLWWGHQIPAWYAPDGKYFVAATEEEAKELAVRHYGLSVPLTRDEDVLDTWFSSALWPFSTLGWPEKTAEVERYYPTSTLITGFDIIFFWVARMMMMGLHFMKEVPFHDVYIHALVRDAKGAKMSKSKGNVIDPLGLIDAFGADALRFTLAAMAAQGRDIKLNEERVAGYRNFATKIWNAARFGEMNGVKLVKGFDPASVKEQLNRWILTEAARAASETTAALEAYKFNEAAGALYRFVWNSYCDWYLELIKPLLQEGSEEAKAETRATAAHVFDQALALLHPFMPFLTEELWAQTGEGGRDRLLALSPWPEPSFSDEQAAAEVNWLVGLIAEIRSVRSEMNIAPSAMLPLVLTGTSEETRARLSRHEAAIRRLARIGSLELAEAPPKGSVQVVVGEATACLRLEGLVDLAAERARLAKEIDKVEKEIGKIDAKLGNPQFMERAKEEAIEEQRERREEAAALQAKLKAALERLGGE
jgi:valyl-tRNA synthetase